MEDLLQSCQRKQIAQKNYIDKKKMQKQRTKGLTRSNPESNTKLKTPGEII